jgi:hypothetical protein
MIAVWLNLVTQYPHFLKCPEMEHALFMANAKLALQIFTDG